MEGQVDGMGMEWDEEWRCVGGLGFCWWGQEVVFEDFLFWFVFVCFAQQGVLPR